MFLVIIMEDKVKKLIEELRPYFIQDGGDIIFIRLEDNYVYIKLTGACEHCSYQDETISYGVETYLKEHIPEIEGVINIAL